MKKLRSEPFPYADEYINYLEVERGLSLITVRSAISNLCNFAQFIKENYHFEFDPNQIKVKHIRGYLAYLKNNLGNGPSTRNNKISIIKGYFKFLELYDFLEEDTDPTRFIRKAKTPKPLPIYLTLEESITLLKTAITKSENPQQDHAVFRLLLQTGCRIGELEKLKLSDLDLNQKYIKVTGKGNEQRLIPLTPNTCQALKQYLEFRACIPSRSDRLFINSKGNPLNRNVIAKSLRNLCFQAGIDKPKLTLHKLRHTCLTLLLKAGVDLPVLKELAGHKKLSTTVRYTHITQKEIRQALNKHPFK
ncbi:MAG: tyrosine-type recombinase/integrase [Erysipelotrichaceae bacterium]|nr:tyrosine-type recombinase/integrase [Erysipelotrichaceae bacterium]